MEISQGLIPYDKYQGQDAQTIENRVYHSSTKDTKKHKPLLWGEDVKRYTVEWNGKEYIKYCSGIANPREPKYFKGKRLLVREITNPRVFSAITSEELYHDPAIIVIRDFKDSKISIESILGILNSQLATFYHFNSSPKATKGEFPKILIEDIKNFPIIRHNDKTAKQYRKLHELVIEYLKSDPKQKEVIDRDIDIEVFKLYKMNFEEAKIIRSSFK